MTQATMAQPMTIKVKKTVRIYSKYSAIVFKQLGFDVRQISETCYLVTYEVEC